MCGPMAYLKVALIWPLRQLNQFARKEKKEEHHHFLDGSTAIKDKNESPFFYFSDKQDEMNFIASIYRGSTVIGVTINTCAD